MSLKQTTLRFLAGLAVMLALLVALVAATLPIIHRWGATDAEVGLDAPPEAVWPWIAQIGDTRGGFYSYTFIENRVGAITGAGDYQVTYVNADRIHPEWQAPQPGDSIIQGMLKIREVKPGQYMLADSTASDAFYWLWLWQVQPAGAGQQTRLLVRFGIGLPGEDSNPVMTLVLDIGGFMMEQRMLQGIKLRAEGGREPAWMENAEIAVWLIALIAGLAAGAAFLVRSNWQKPLTVAVAAVVALFVLTFVQPALWLRVLVDTLLIAGLIWAWEPTLTRARAHLRPHALVR
jgi:hypothetical protein